MSIRLVAGAVSIGVLHVFIQRCCIAISHAHIVYSFHKELSRLISLEPAPVIVKLRLHEHIVHQYIIAHIICMQLRSDNTSKVYTKYVSPLAHWQTLVSQLTTSPTCHYITTCNQCVPPQFFQDSI